MSKPKIEERVAALEAQMERVLAQVPQPGPDDWKSVVGMCTGDEDMKQIDALGAGWREADRERGRVGSTGQSMKVPSKEGRWNRPYVTANLLGLGYLGPS